MIKKRKFTMKSDHWCMIKLTNTISNNITGACVKVDTQTFNLKTYSSLETDMDILLKNITFTRLLKGEESHLN